MKKNIITALLCALVLIGCKEKKVKSQKHDLNHAFDFKLNSNDLTLFFKNHDSLSYDTTKVLEFYQKRGFSYAWINESGKTENVDNFINLLNNEKLINRLTNTTLNQFYEGLSSFNISINISNPLITEFELLLTSEFINYAKRNWQGISNESFNKAGWYLDRNKNKVNDLLENLISEKFDLNKPELKAFKQYYLLKNKLLYFKSINHLNYNSLIVSDLKKATAIDSASSIIAVKKLLYVFHDLPKLDSTSEITENFIKGIKHFQKRHGLKQDGTLGKRTLAELRVPINERINQILVNLERNRWMPALPNNMYIIVNIPEYKLYAYKNNKVTWSTNVIVGDSSTSTVIFSDSIKYIVLNPYWYLPKSIIFNEIVPQLYSNPNYFAHHEMEIVTYSNVIINPSSIRWGKYTPNNFPYRIRQKPGKNNSLGLVKFLFPNSHNIYMHDTPSKSLFGESSRAFSHGCIRVQNPFELVDYLLKGDNDWDSVKINTKLSAQKEIYVPLKKPVPVYLTYFTSWVDETGLLNFRNDIYLHDQKLKAILLNDETNTPK